MDLSGSIPLSDLSGSIPSVHESVVECKDGSVRRQVNSTTERRARDHV